MKKIMCAFSGILLAASLFIIAATAVAGPIRTGEFQVQLNGFDQPVTWDPSANDGYNSTWFVYPQSQVPVTIPEMSPWWSQWWYNDPFLQPGGKWVKVEFDWEPVDSEAMVLFHVSVNWTTAAWTGQSTPPVGDVPEEYLERLDYHWSFFRNPGGQGGRFESGELVLPIDYNPEWVSIDVRGINAIISGGVVEHQCVPLPPAAWLLGPGLAGLILIRRRRAG